VRSGDEVAAWYATELFHIYLLRQLVNLLGVGVQSYIAIKLVYGTMLLLTAAIIAKALRDLGMSLSRTSLIAALFLINPLSVYLGFKMMGEVPSIFLAVSALALFTTGLRKQKWQVALAMAAGIALTLSALASAKMPLLFLAFWIALLCGWLPKEQRKPAIKAGVASCIAFLISLPIGVWFLGGSIDIYFLALSGFMGFTKRLPMWAFAIFNLGLIGMALWIIMPLAWLSSDRRSRRFFLLWLFFSTMPILLTTINFMEPRYLVTGLIPFVGLVGLGFEAVFERMKSCRVSFQTALASLMVFVVLTGSVAAQSFMPYETDADRLIRAVRYEAPDDETVILLPWNYTDFHLLRFVFPQRPIYLVQSAVMTNGESIEDPAWTAGRLAAYGRHYLSNAYAFPAELVDRRVLFIGWTILPSLQNLHEFLRFTGLSRLAEHLESSRFLDHMKQSWLWDCPNTEFREVARYGQYRVHEVNGRKIVECGGVQKPNYTRPSNILGRFDADPL
jgi:hypothetical protein